MAKDMGEFSENRIDKVEKGMKLSAEDKVKITGAGAKALSKVSYDHTSRNNEIYRRGCSVGHANAKHRNSRRKTKHLQGTITYKAGCTVDKTHTGDTDVGFEGKYYDFSAEVVNNGQHHTTSRRYKNIRFLDKVQQEAKKPVAQAELKAYKEMMNHDSGE